MVRRALLPIAGIFAASFIITLFFIVLMGAPLVHNACIASASSVFIYSFNIPGILHEARRESESTSPYWFFDSGGKLIIANGVGATIQGSLPLGDYWSTLYALSNPIDTDGGTHPQNIFRLVTKGAWDNISMESWFFIVRDNLSRSSNRNASNGLLLMSRYRDSDTLYYAGIRVDGAAVIKKKYDGIYYTMAYVPLFPGKYAAATRPNLLPQGIWLGLRGVTETNSDGSVLIRLYLKRTEQMPWELAVSAADRGQFGGTAPITGDGKAGIRTDFMDVLFKNIRIEQL